jgi:hypothetical protein
MIHDIEADDQDQQGSERGERHQEKGTDPMDTRHSDNGADEQEGGSEEREHAQTKSSPRHLHPPAA